MVTKTVRPTGTATKIYNETVLANSSLGKLLLQHAGVIKPIPYPEVVPEPIVKEPEEGEEESEEEGEEEGEEEMEV